MITSLPMLLTPTSITVVVDGTSYTVLESDKRKFHMLRNTILGIKGTPTFDDVDAIRRVLNSNINSSADFSKDFVFENGTVYYHPANSKEEREALPPILSERVYDLYLGNHNFDSFLNFFKLLKSNPSNRAINEFYKFLEHRNLPIDADGYVYAYKAVRPNFYDIHSGKFLNAIGSVLSMPRNKVDDDANRHCSHGFHVGSLEYVRWYGHADSKYLICKFSPADVVSVPNDHNCQKVRVCQYEVVSEYTGPLPSTLIGASDPAVESFDDYDPNDESWLENFWDDGDCENIEDEEDPEEV